MLLIMISIWLAGSIVYLLYSKDDFIDEAKLAGGDIGFDDIFVAWLICLGWPILIVTDDINWGK